MAAAANRGDVNRVNGFDDIPRPFLIGVGGGTASGKVTDEPRILILWWIVLENVKIVLPPYPCARCSEI